MDYEKLHKDTIAKLQEMVNSGKIAVEIARGICADFIPESEDEKIRKAIYNCVKWFGFDSCFFKDVSQEECLAWLDNQGEQKPVIVPKFRVGDFVKDANYHGEPIYEIVGMDNKCYICEYRGNKSMGDKSVMHFSFDNPYLRLVEHNPAETEKGAKGNEREIPNSTWSEEDEKILNLIIARLHSHLNVEAEEYDKDYYWLKSLKDRVLPQPEQEWSEEDETIAKALIKAANDNVLYGYIGNSKLLEWLKSLRPQSTWKPSDKQMEALDFAIDCVVPDEFNYKKQTLKDLLEQLKKLMEG